jgi:hypothetical protein
MVIDCSKAISKLDVKLYMFKNNFSKQFFKIRKDLEKWSHKKSVDKSLSRRVKNAFRIYFEGEIDYAFYDESYDNYDNYGGPSYFIEPQTEVR